MNLNKKYYFMNLLYIKSLIDDCIKYRKLEKIKVVLKVASNEFEKLGIKET